MDWLQSIWHPSCYEDQISSNYVVSVCRRDDMPHQNFEPGLISNSNLELLNIVVKLWWRRWLLSDHMCDSKDHSLSGRVISDGQVIFLRLRHHKHLIPNSSNWNLMDYYVWDAVWKDTNSTVWNTRDTQDPGKIPRHTTGAKSTSDNESSRVMSNHPVWRTVDGCLIVIDTVPCFPDLILFFCWAPLRQKWETFILIRFTFESPSLEKVFFYFTKAISTSEKWRKHHSA